MNTLSGRLGQSPRDRELFRRRGGPLVGAGPMTLRNPKPTFATVHALRPLAEPSDAQLVERAKNGDRTAEAAIYQRHVGYTTNLCLRLLGNRSEAEDAAQDTFVTVLEELASLREPERLRHWIARIAVNKAHRKFRRRKLLRMLGFSSTPDEDLVLLPERAGLAPEQSLELSHLGSVLSRLSDELRAAWTLRYVDGYQIAETAALCGCSVATVKRRIAAAHEVVQQHVQMEELDHD